MYSKYATKICPMTPSHWGRRYKPIDAVVIHYTASVVTDAKKVVDYWEQSNPYTSANYIIDVYGNITACVAEEFRPYTSGSSGLGSRDIDDHAITIECSCRDSGPAYEISDITILSLCRLMADIGIRYGIQWRFTGNENGNMHAHKWYQSTPCPGEYLYKRFPVIEQIANNYIELEAMTKRYDSVKTVPDWYKSEIQWLIDKGYLKGSGSGLDLSKDMLRTLVIMVRALRGELNV